MSSKIVGVSMDAQFFEKLETRRKELNISRSEYLRGLVLKDLGVQQ